MAKRPNAKEPKRPKTLGTKRPKRQEAEQKRDWETVRLGEEETQRPRDWETYDQIMRPRDRNTRRQWPQEADRKPMEQLSLWGSPHEFVFLVTSRLVFIRRSPIGLCKVDSLSLLYISSLSFWLMNLATWFITVPYQFVNSYCHYIDTSINIMINNVIIIVLISSLLIPHDLLLLLIPYTVIRAK